MAARKKTKNTPQEQGRPGTGRGFPELSIILMLLFAVLIIIGFFAKEAAVLKPLCDGIKYLLGVGFFIVPFILTAVAAYLIMTLNKSKRKRWIVSALFMPFFAGAIGHIVTASARYGSVKSLILDGADYKSGGLLAGGAAELMIKALSRPGAGVVLLVLFALNLLAFLDIKLSSIFSFLAAKMEKSRENAAAKRALAREERDFLRAEEERAKLTEPAAYEIPARQKKTNIDIPLNSKRSIDIPLDGYVSAPVGKFPVPGARDHAEQEAEYKQTSLTQSLAEKKPQREKPKVSMTPEELDQEISRVDKDASAPVSPEYVYPPIGLLRKEPPISQEDVESEIRMNAGKLIATLESFNIEAWIINVTRGPAVTRYEIQLGSGIKTSRITALSEDIALSLAAQSVRISHIPDKSAVGIEVPNKIVSIVRLRDVVESKEFAESRSKATFALGKDISGKPVVSDIARLPHMLVGGTTNSGKSVCINSLLISLIYKASPADLRLILIDPKMVEFISYNGIPHLLIPVVTDSKKAAGALQWAVMEMMLRYKRFNELGVRNFSDYNDEVERREKLPKGDDGDGPVLERMARIIIVIDELADLMLASPGEVEESICRIAQMARAAGMHLIVATQRPSADIITGLMKANIPSRIAFSVASSLESRIIIDQIGAEKLLGRGDMLFNPIGANKPVRIQGCFITGDEIEAVVDYIKNGYNAVYNEDILTQIDKNAVSAGKGKKNGLQFQDEEPAGEDDYDELFDDAVDVVLDAGQASTSMLQRRLKLGFTRAARIVDQMEESGIVGVSEGSKPRQLLITKDEWAEMKYRKSCG